MNDEGPAAERGRDVVIRIRRRRPAEDWRLGRVLSWSASALFGDPLMLLAPLFSVVILMLWVFALGAPARADVMVPLVSLPPLDAFLDVGVIELTDRAAAEIWILRSVALALRTAVFGVLVVLAVQRARGEVPSLGAATRTLWRRARTFGFLELVSFAFFGVSLTLGADLASVRDDGAIGTALLFGVMILVGTFIAAADGHPAGAAFRRGNFWIRRRPVGHVLLVLGYGFLSNGLFRLAAAGEAVPRAFPLTLYAFVAALVTMYMVLAFARRFALLYRSERPALPA
ncbi:MAG TPA: hypothetical protein VJ922_08015 [Actinomycetota bacterium]|nr:hypothetical protein [Actinomycetota bacterium]